MTPIDPAEKSSPDPRPASAPPYVDEDPNLDLVKQGVEAADDEAREAVADAYEAGARKSGKSTEAMDDNGFTDPGDPGVAPELAAMHEETLLSGGEEEEEE